MIAAANQLKGPSQLKEVVEDIYKINVMTNRVRKRKSEWANSKPKISAIRSRAAARAWMESEHEHVYVRRAKVFHRICEEVPISIFNQELVVGSQTDQVRGAYTFDDWTTGVSESILQGNISLGTGSECSLSAEDFEIIKENLAYWRTRNPQDHLFQKINNKFGIDISHLANTGVILCRPFEGTWGLGRGANYEKVLAKGLSGIIREAEEKSEVLNFDNGEDIEKWNLLQAAIISMRGLVIYAKRYASLAREICEVEQDSTRRSELKHIAEICERVPEHPARTFREAVQSIRFIQLGLNLETAGFGEVLGRLDQVLWPYYIRDCEEGRLTREQAIEIIACLVLKINEMENLKTGEVWTQIGPGNTGTHIFLGGVDQWGDDASNELSFLILRAVHELKLRVGVYLRVHEGTPDALMHKAILANKVIGGGGPAFMNDKRIIGNFVEDGYPIEEARNYTGVGCVHSYITESEGMHGMGPSLNTAKSLELVMYNGWDPRTQQQVGLATGDPCTFTSIADWLDAWKRQQEHFHRFYHPLFNYAWHVRGQIHALPFCSALTNDCLDKGKDVLRDGVRYPQSHMPTYEPVRANIADGLMAIKHWVYDEKKLTTKEILDACKGNFEGDSGEQIRQMLLAAPKYGNDYQEADSLMAEVSHWNSKDIRKMANPFGYPVKDMRSGAGLHYQHGRYVGALPDGRKAYDCLSDGGISPMAGADVNGPTAVICSVGKAIDIHSNRSAVLNQKLSSLLLDSKENIEKLSILIKTFFFDFLGYQIQFNIIDRERLVAAKSNPVEHRDLVVRVGGYSAYFVDLPPIIQDEIINRTDQQI